MRHKYITNQIMLACLSKLPARKDIHDELHETLAERKRIMRELERISRKAELIDMFLDKRKAA
ncbi:MAG: hypothetical protein JNK14_20470 [Chitinophagaceae bacterium]|nr:hypothetical protein [Chitinophagaceae bacterium]